MFQSHFDMGWFAIALLDRIVSADYALVLQSCTGGLIPGRDILTPSILITDATLMPAIVSLSLSHLRIFREIS
jgi:hypothetical protein